MATIKFETPRVYIPLCKPSRYKGAHGGRGSGKSHFLAEKLLEDCIAEPGESGEGMKAVCIREVQKDLAQSSKALIERKLIQHKLDSGHGFKVFKDCLQTPKDGIIIFKGMNDYTADSIKSLEGFKRSWWEEAQTATARSLQMLRPTLREANSELWFSWNPRMATDPIDVLLRGNEKPTDSIVVRSGWKDNPFFPAELEQERLDCLRISPEHYGHIWEGEYVTVQEGSYFAKHLTEARLQGRVCRVQADGLMTIRLFADIGGTGARADNFVFWAVQFVGREIRWINHYEQQGQPIETHVNWLRSQGYTPDRAQIILPHDGDTQDKVHDASYAKAFRDLGYEVEVVPNQGKGAAKARIEALRRVLPISWFDEKCEPGLSALGWYHEKRDEFRNIGLGPDHDWSSHSSDAAGLVAICYEAPKIAGSEKPIRRALKGIV
jgi:phage terminase large subunit